jgi:hypothetical protein
LLLAVNLVPHFLCGTQNNPKLVTWLGAMGISKTPQRQSATSAEDSR